ncbi:MAG: molybdopterin-dependent oxidoreductase [Gemmatimonadaceae bacterium]
MIRRLFVLLFLLTAFPKLLAAQATGDSLIVRVEGRPPRIVHAADLRALPRDTVRSTMRHGEGLFRGPLLEDVLRLAGVALDSVRGPKLADYAVFEASDGYRVVFGLSELADDISGRRMLLADELDGKPLPPSEAPWRLVVPGDLHATRWVRQVITVTVRHAP